SLSSGEWETLRPSAERPAPMLRGARNIQDAAPYRQRLPGFAGVRCALSVQGAASGVGGAFLLFPEICGRPSGPILQAVTEAPLPRPGRPARGARWGDRAPAPRARPAT